MQRRPGASKSAAVPPGGDRLVYDAYIAGRQSAAMAVSVRAGLFDLLGRRSREGAPSAPFAELCSKLGWSERGARSMLGALCAMGLLRRDAGADAYAATEDALRSLTRDTPGSLWGLIDMEVDHFLSPKALETALAKDDASVYGDIDPWAAHEADPAKARAFTAAMHSVSERPAEAFAHAIQFPSPARVLDVGGGSGALSIAIAREHPSVQCVVFDMGSVCPIAEEYIASAGVGAQVTARVGDMFADPYPAGFDAILFSQILHDWNHLTGAELLGRAFAALPPGGRVVIHEKLVEDDGVTPLANVLVSLDMLVWTEGQQYGVSELFGALRAAGFTGPERTKTTGYWSLVVATKP